MSKSNKLPAIQFYPGDWKKDAGVQSLSFHDRAIWLEILFLMHESTQRGKLTLNGKAVPIESLARMIGIDVKVLNKSLTNIIDAGVADVDQETNVLICRRMVRDEQLRQLRKEVGKLGGNPNLVNQNTTKQPTKTQPKEPITTNQIATPSISYSISSSDNILKPKDFLKDEILNQGYWMSIRSTLSGYYQSDTHLMQLLDAFCEANQHEPFNNTKHRVNAFRYHVKNLNNTANTNQKQIVATPNVAVSKPMAD